MSPQLSYSVMPAASSVMSEFLGLFTYTLSTADAVLVCFAVACVAYMQFMRTKHVPAKGANVWKRQQFKKQYYESDNSTDAGGYSASEFSDRSSRTDSSATCMGRRRMPVGARSQTAPHLNVNAPTFVPSQAYTPAQTLQAMLAGGKYSPGMPENSQQIRESIKTLKGALENWEASLPGDAPGPLLKNDALALVDSLSKLTPQQAAIVRSMLDGKLGASQPSMPPVKASQRSFTPFGNPSPCTKRPPGNARGQPVYKPKGRVYEEGEEENSLRTHLRDLAQIPNERVLMVRRINRFGLDSAVPLQRYFAKFGEVDKIFVAPTRAKPQNDHNQVRIRAAPLGFVTMTTVEAAKAVLALGSDHSIEGQSIGVFPFASHGIEN